MKNIRLAPAPRTAERNLYAQPMKWLAASMGVALALGAGILAPLALRAF
jgi:hypothetical protein